MKTAKQTVVNAAERVGNAMGNTLSNFKTAVIETTNQVVEQVKNKIIVGKSVVMGGAQNVIFNALEQQKTVREKVSDFFVDLWTNATKKVLSQNLSRKPIIWNNGQLQFVELVILEVLTDLVKVKSKPKTEEYLKRIGEIFEGALITSSANKTLQFRDYVARLIAFKKSLENLTRNRAAESQWEKTDTIINGSPNLSDGKKAELMVFGQNKYINRQQLCVGAFLGNQQFRLCGCEVIAVYNALRRLGIDVKLADVIFWAERLDEIVLGGFGGINPNAVSRLLDYTELDYLQFYKLEDMDSEIKVGDTYILSVWNTADEVWQKLHTYMVYAFEDENVIKLKAYNGFEETYTSFEQIVQSEGNEFCRGYRVKLPKKRNAVFKALIPLIKKIIDDLT